VSENGIRNESDEHHQKINGGFPLSKDGDHCGLKYGGEL